jgi:hypothetical protein
MVFVGILFQHHQVFYDGEKCGQAQLWQYIQGSCFYIQFSNSCGSIFKDYIEGVVYDSREIKVVES